MTNTASPAGRRYIKRFMPVTVIYVALVLGVSWAFNTMELTGPVAWALAAAPALPLLGMIWAMGMYLREETDEFQRSVLIESILWGLGLTMAGLSVWGFLEIYVDAPKLPTFLAFPLFCGAMGIAQPFVRRRYR
jgi:hypothetical protein